MISAAKLALQARKSGEGTEGISSRCGFRISGNASVISEFRAECVSISQAVPRGLYCRYLGISCYLQVEVFVTPDQVMGVALNGESDMRTLNTSLVLGTVGAAG